jgi:SAM-dependent methyltransferase
MAGLESTEGAVTGANGQAACRACASGLVYSERLVCRARRAAGKSATFVICRNCGLAFAPEHVHAYEGAQSFSRKSKPGNSKKARVGDGKRAGREYHIAAMGVAILQKPRPSVLVFGAGLSRDFLLIEKKLRVSRAAVCDLGNFMAASDFVPIDAKASFDIVVASEVIEHFTDFERDFGNLFSKRGEHGIVIAATNISDGAPLERMVYPFSASHSAYYSGESLYHVARRFGLEADFRAPQLAYIGGSPRKRYIIFGKREELSLAALYFSKKLWAPCESLLLRPLRNAAARAGDDGEADNAKVASPFVRPEEECEGSRLTDGDREAKGGL